MVKHLFANNSFRYSNSPVSKVEISLQMIARKTQEMYVQTMEKRQVSKIRRFK